MSGARVPTAARLAYAAPAFAMAVIGIPVYVYVPKFYTDVVGVDVVLVGLVLLGARLFDAVTDPLAGWLSDRTRSRFGRRRPWIVAASLPLALALAALFNPPAAGGAIPALWLAFGIFALFLCFTAASVPYEALGPELTFDYHERTSLLGLRDGALLAGTLFAAAVPSAIAVALGEPTESPGRGTFAWMALLFAPLLVAACVVCAVALRERARHHSAAADAFGGLRLILSNRPFRVLLISYTVAALGSNLPATLLLYYVQYVLESDRAGLFLVLYFVAGIAFLPGWIALSRRFGKKRAWLAGMAVNTGAFSGVFFLGPGDELAYGLLVVLSGVGLGATLAIPSSMQADVIDYDELRSGERREGRYVGIWSVAKKLAAALGVGVALLVFGSSGYAPNVQQSEEVRFALRSLYALVPCLCNIVAFVIALAYPIDADTHREIRAEIDAGRVGADARDPLATGVLRPAAEGGAP